MPLIRPLRRQQQVAALEKARRVRMENLKLAPKAKVAAKAKTKSRAKAQATPARASSEMEKAKAKAKAQAKARAAQGKAKPKSDQGSRGSKRQVRGAAPDPKRPKVSQGAASAPVERYVESHRDKVRRWFQQFVGDGRAYFEKFDLGIILFEPPLRGEWGPALEVDYPGTRPEDRPQVLWMPRALSELDFRADALMKKDHMLLPLPLLKEVMKIHAWLSEGLHAVGPVEWKVTSMWKGYLNPLLSKTASFMLAGDKRGAFAMLLGLLIFAQREENWIPYRHFLVDWNEFCNFWKALGELWKDLLKASDQVLGLSSLRSGPYRSPCRSYRPRLLLMLEDFEQRTNQALKPVARQAMLRNQLLTSTSSSSAALKQQQQQQQLQQLQQQQSLLRFKIFDDAKNRGKAKLGATKPRPRAPPSMEKKVEPVLATAPAPLQEEKKEVLPIAPAPLQEEKKEVPAAASSTCTTAAPSTAFATPSTTPSAASFSLEGATEGSIATPSVPLEEDMEEDKTEEKKEEEKEDKKEETEEAKAQTSTTATCFNEEEDKVEAPMLSALPSSEENK